MSEEQKPEPGDTVQVTFQAVYRGQAGIGSPTRVEVEKDGRSCLATVPDGATVEVLETADDPRKDGPSTVRVSPGGAQYVKVEAREGVEPWVFLCGGSGADAQFPRLPDGGVVGWPYADPVPVAAPSDPAPGGDPDTPVTLLVHPYMWKSIVAYLSGMWIRVLKVSRSAEAPVYEMRPVSGKWGSGDE